MNIVDIKEKSKNQLIMVDFFANWCGPCKTLGPIIEKVSEETGINLLKVNVDEFKDLTSFLNIRGIPVVIFFKDGIEIERITGMNPASRYLDVINEIRVSGSTI